MTNKWTAESTKGRHGTVWSLCRDGEPVVTCGSQERAEGLVAERVEYDRIVQDGIDHAIRCYRDSILNGTDSERQDAYSRALKAGATHDQVIRVIGQGNAAEYARCNADYREESLGDLMSDIGDGYID